MLLVFRSFEKIIKQNNTIILKINTLTLEQQALKERLLSLEMNNNNNNNSKSADAEFVKVRISRSWGDLRNIS